MGEARRRELQGLPPRKKKIKQDDSPRIVSWLPITKNQATRAVEISTRAAWIGIGALVVLWIVIRFIGPAAGWWTLADSL